MANGGNGRAKITVFSDYVCPFCYLEEPDLARVREEFGDGVEVDWRAYELRPDPIPTLDPDGEYLHRVWNASVYPMARSLGMTLRLPPVQPRSRKAFEAAEFARLAGRFDAMNRALFKAFFEDGRDLADLDTLIEIGRSVGLDGAELRHALASGRHTDQVLEDQRIAKELGLSGVPALVVTAGETAYLVSGAQPYEAVRGAIEQAAGGRQLAG
jgi:predicted DsbA family dithiol-disulfide isomerase